MKIDGHAFVSGTPHVGAKGRYEFLFSEGTPDTEVVLAQNGLGQQMLLRHPLDDQGALHVTVPSPQAGTTQTWQVFTADPSGTLILEGSFTLTAPAADPVPDPSLFVITWMTFWGIMETVWNFLVRTYRAWKGTIGTAIAVLIVIGLVGGCIWGMWEGVQWAISDDGSSEPAQKEASQASETPPEKDDAGTPSAEADAQPDTVEAPADPCKTFWTPPNGNGQRVGLDQVYRVPSHDTAGWQVYAFKDGHKCACRKMVSPTLGLTTVYLAACPQR